MRKAVERRFPIGVQTIRQYNSKEFVRRRGTLISCGWPTGRLHEQSRLVRVGSKESHATRLPCSCSPPGSLPLAVLDSKTAAYKAPPTVPPMIGASQNNQSCPSAHPPTRMAGPVLRAGFTERFVTGIPIRWISVNPSPIAIGAKPDGARRSVAPIMIITKKEGQYHFRDKA